MVADLSDAAGLTLAAGLDMELPATNAYGRPLRRCAGRRPRGRGAGRPRRGARPAHEAAARPVRATLRRRCRAHRSLAGTTRQVALAGRPAVDRAARERRHAATATRPRHASRSSARTPTTPATWWATTGTSCTSRRCWRTADARASPGRPRRSTCSWPTSWPPGPTVLDAIRARVGPAPRSATAAGCGVLEARTTRSRRRSRPRGAPMWPSSCWANGPGLTTRCTCGETRDRCELGLPGRQAELRASGGRHGHPGRHRAHLGPPTGDPSGGSPGGSRPSRLGTRRGRPGGHRRGALR